MINTMSSLKKYAHAVIATDVVIFTVRDHSLQVLLIKMKKPPYQKHWAAPGGLVRGDESLEDAAKRLLNDKTGVKETYLEQLAAFGDPKRDPFGRVVSVAYFALIPSERLMLKTTDEYADVRWFPVARLPELAYDHREIVKTALARLQAKLEYTNIVYGLLPKEFSLSALQRLYEVILARPLDKRNFRKKYLSLGLVRPVTGKSSTGAHRPAQLYTFSTRKPAIVNVL